MAVKEREDSYICHWCGKEIDNGVTCNCSAVRTASKLPDCPACGKNHNCSRCAQKIEEDSRTNLSADIEVPFVLTFEISQSDIFVVLPDDCKRMSRDVVDDIQKCLDILDK